MVDELRRHRAISRHHRWPEVRTIPGKNGPKRNTKGLERAAVVGIHEKGQALS